MLGTGRLRCYPHDDGEFAALVEQLADEIWEPSMDQATAVDLISRHLRGRYPEVRIAVRSSLAGFTDRDVVWYVYRDGDIVGRDGRDLGAMHARTAGERLARGAVETVVRASSLLAVSRTLRAEAVVAVMDSRAGRQS